MNEKRSAERVRGTAGFVLPRVVTGPNNLLSTHRSDNLVYSILSAVYRVLTHVHGISRVVSASTLGNLSH